MLDKKVAVVTGASRGIGREIALELASKGIFVVINYNGNEQKANEVKEQIEGAGGEAVIRACDVSDYSACEDFFAWIIKEYGRIDILINNAGITKDGLLMRMSEEDFSKVIDVNLKGTFNCIRQVTRTMMKQKGGRIVNLSSVVGVSGNVGQANYAASKAGVIGLTKSVAKELASRNITVNAIAPGFIETDMTDVLSEGVKEEMLKQIPMKCFGKPSDIAKTAAFLVSDDARYITGQVLCVDGGLV
jgi:3-oxoacyl-[acyl-carrier protein] reductase